jgi:predicted CxxxxCH...CXXCH cytochrome family protein
MDEGSAAFHAASANQGLANCQQCHGAKLDGLGGTAAVSCASCHGASWATTCTMCHGGNDDATGAPPKATWANGGDAVRVGAHTAHLSATHALANPVACATCHTVPADAFEARHIDGATAEIKFAGLAARGVTPSWDRASATCSSTYCHGATLSGGAQKAPVWTTLDGTQRACGSCHGAPPANAYHTRTDLSCGSCHTGYSAAAVVARTHVDGNLDYSVTCTSCHGDSARAASGAAPPAGTHGETATTSRAVGAHLKHLQGGSWTNGIACSECHAVPTSMLHANNTVDISWGPLARAGGSAPAWNRTSNTCSSNWCHGAKLTGGTDTTPIWTRVDGTQDACGTCHGRPPSSGEHGEHRGEASCGDCHATGYSTTAVNKTLHVNGVLDVKGARIRSWDPVTRRCYPTCHGSESWGSR